MRPGILGCGLLTALLACGEAPAPRCGDGSIDGREQCDDGNAQGGDGCSATCQNESSERALCGDAVLEAAEDCDDGNALAGDGCDPSCRAEGAMACGNHRLERGEQCDDGNQLAGDGCSATCTIERPSGRCTPTRALTCASRDQGSTATLDATRDVSGYACVPWNEVGPEQTYVLVADHDGSIELHLEAPAGLDLFVLAGGDGEVCDPTACVAAGQDRVTLQAKAGATYFVVVDGYLGAAGDYTLAVTCAP